MQLFATYTFGQALLTVLELALLFLWVWLAITVIIDVFRSHDLSGWAKAGWLVLIVLRAAVGRAGLRHRPQRQDESPPGQRRTPARNRIHRRARGPKGSRDPH